MRNIPLPSFLTDAMSRFRTSTSWLLALAAAVWVSLTLICPLGAHLNWPLTPYLYAFFSPLCHQSPDRSFHLFTEPFGVCARCFGLYVGFWLGLVVWPLMPRLSTRLLERPRLLLVFAVPIGLDLLTENTHATRYFSGLIASFPVALFFWAGIEQLGASFERFARRNL